MVANQIVAISCYPEAVSPIIRGLIPVGKDIPFLILGLSLPSAYCLDSHFGIPPSIQLQHTHSIHHDTTSLHSIRRPGLNVCF